MTNVQTKIEKYVKIKIAKNTFEKNVKNKKKTISHKKLK